MSESTETVNIHVQHLSIEYQTIFARVEKSLSTIYALFLHNLKSEIELKTLNRDEVCHCASMKRRHMASIDSKQKTRLKGLLQSQSLIRMEGCK